MRWRRADRRCESYTLSARTLFALNVFRLS